MQMQLTLMLVKPDAMENGDLGAILDRVTTAGFEVRSLIVQKPNCDFMSKFYNEHEGKWFFDRQVAFMSSGPVAAMELAKDNAIADLRELVGATVPAEAAPGTLRYDFGDREGGLPRNAVHASDSTASARRERDLVFGGYPSLRIHPDTPIIGTAPGKQSGKWDKPVDMLVFKVLYAHQFEAGNEIDASQLPMVAHTDFYRALAEVYEKPQRSLWLCEATVIGQPRLVPAAYRDCTVGFWESDEPWEGRWSPVSAGVRAVPPGDVACTRLKLLQELDVPKLALPAHVVG
jgi:nucleoside-diphosphate kinase